MVEIGYAISSEEHPAKAQVEAARRAEEVGFQFLLISDHFHPWIDNQGYSPFVWSVLGGIAHATKHIRVGTGVTCPTIRIHPAIIAQAAATTASLMDGRFFLGVGTGENLNEHILGDHWPPFDVRAEMLEEAIEVMRKLWTGEMQSHYGVYYVVENARLYTIPETPPEVMIAAAGTKAAELAGRIGDGLINVSPDSEVVQEFEKHGSKNRPKFGKLTVCWAEDEAEARRTAFEYWPTAALTGELSQELPLPAHFEQAAKMVTEEDVAKAVVCGSDPQKHLEHIQKFIEAGFDHVYVHQIGPDQEGFFQFYQKHILPEFQQQPVAM